ncbi:DEKNAAC101048 [Brettanomyces naardenensis]|uniref:B-related factor 1 n=1 Tax=Brettanomyces naardenensis TaxID=13370 RepID=A0A448YGT8_BRENA|nr:DEKNAAC101048 [Brettanomyces naardenensis]
MTTVVPRKLRCKVCGNTEFSREYHTASSDLACTKCGTVLEENPIVSEVTFAENASGGATVQGSFVGSDQSHANFGNNRGSLDSREQTLSNGRKRIKNVASALGIPDYISDAAYQWFQLALTNNFVQGRRSQNVVAACLYIACRKEKTHHMLIDFSSRLQVSVYAIGATFLKMVKALHITELPLVDPSLFIQHFADRLDFGKLKLRVINDAVKLAKRMDDDWLYEGRRPAGIAGACLLLAARMNNFRRTHSEIVAVTHIGSTTIQKRLHEFQSTQASTLTVDQFRKDNQNVERSLPPSFKKGRLAERKRKKAIRDSEAIEGHMKEDPVLSALLEDSEVTEEEIQAHIKRVLKRQLRHNQNSVNGKVFLGKDGIEIGPEEDDEDDAEELNRADTQLEKMIERNRPKNLARCLPSTAEVLSGIPDDDNLSSVEDEEIDGILLSKEESKLKERIWVGNNQDYLLEQEKRRLKEEADKIAGHTPHIRKKRRRNVNGELLQSQESMAAYLQSDTTRFGLSEALGETLTPADSAKSLLQKKSLSKKINYAAVNELFNDS